MNHRRKFVTTESQIIQALSAWLSVSAIKPALNIGTIFTRERALSASTEPFKQTNLQCGFSANDDISIKLKLTAIL
ncbi:hypothetical protein [Vibrio proteolyticus]